MLHNSGLEKISEHVILCRRFEVFMWKFFLLPSDSATEPHVAAGQLFEAAYVEGGGQGLHTVQLARFAIVDRVGRHQPGQQARFCTLHLVEVQLLNSGPGAVDHSGPGILHHLSVSRGESGGASWGQAHTWEALAKLQFVQEAKFGQPPA